MKTIELNCFENSETCFIISDEKKLKITNDNEDYLLTINNLSDQTCDLNLFLESKDKFPKDLELTVFSEKELSFHQNLLKNTKNSIKLGKIYKKSSKKYDFCFNFPKNEAFSLKFDLNFNFSCYAPSEPETTLLEIVTNSTKTNNKKAGQVLGKTTTIQESTTPEEKFSLVSKPKFFLYLILLVALIFVIMIFVNGKKKKKNYSKKEK